MLARVTIVLLNVRDCWNNSNYSNNNIIIISSIKDISLVDH